MGRTCLLTSPPNHPLEPVLWALSWMTVCQGLGLVCWMSLGRPRLILVTRCLPSPPLREPVRRGQRLVTQRELQGGAIRSPHRGRGVCRTSIVALTGWARRPLCTVNRTSLCRLDSRSYCWTVPGGGARLRGDPMGDTRGGHLPILTLPPQGLPRIVRTGRAPRGRFLTRVPPGLMRPQMETGPAHEVKWQRVRKTINNKQSIWLSFISSRRTGSGRSISGARGSCRNGPDRWNRK